MAYLYFEPQLALIEPASTQQECSCSPVNPFQFSTKCFSLPNDSVLSISKIW